MQPDDLPPIPEPLVETLLAARHVVVLTGAGISAESGIPTFRDRVEGLWSKYRMEDLSTPAAFRRDPQLVWEWYAHLREAMRRAEPNPGHYALVELERRVPRLTLLTQNIDDLHRRAGSSAVVELHGNIFRARCDSDGAPVEGWEDLEGTPPRCPRCGGLVRPGVVWFGEQLPKAALETAEAAVRGCDVLFSIGTSSEVEPAASFAPRALDHGATVVMVNLDVRTSAAAWLYRFHAKAGSFLPYLIQTVWGRS
jgi:NAD-dependent deacetylase